MELRTLWRVSPSGRPSRADVVRDSKDFHLFGDGLYVGEYDTIH